jgi:FAD/FMN-containing dehydrogenase
MAIKQELASIVGPECVSDDPEVLESYSKDYSFVQPRSPRCVVWPKNAEEVMAIVKYANGHTIPVTPRSSGVSFYGAGLPSQGGMIVDLSRMNKILKVDPRNKFVKIEPGVTWGQIQEELEKQDVMVCNPLLPHPSKSVLTSSMEREPILIPKSEYDETFLTAEMVLPNGEMYWTGTAMGKGMASGNFPDCLYPGARLFMGVQGTLGIVTWANIKAEWLPKVEKVLFMSFERIEDLVEPIYRIQRRMIGRECFVLNSFNLAAILAENWPQDFKSLRESLPPWILMLSLAGLHRLPAEKIEYEEEAVREVASELHIDVFPTVSNIPGLGKKISSMVRKPWLKDGYWKFRYKGSCHDIFFHTTLNRVAEFTKAVNEVSAKHGYPTKEIGFYLQPIEYGRACFCQYGFHCDPNDAKDVERVRGLYLEASERAMGMGGLFVTPYGPWADMVYRRTSSFTAVMKVVKQNLDPNNIMNPGKLCF